MLSHAYSLGQRVKVPGFIDVQGVVTLPRAARDFEQRNAPHELDQHRYFVRYILSDGSAGCGWYSEGEMKVANTVAAPATGGVVGDLWWKPTEFPLPPAGAVKRPSENAPHVQHIAEIINKVFTPSRARSLKRKGLPSGRLPSKGSGRGAKRKIGRKTARG